MHRTIYDTPGICTVLRWISIAGLRLAGWRCEGQRPTAPKYVLICAPHTSNWDWVVFMAMIFVFRARLYYMVKDSLCRGPFGPFMMWMGAIPIDRSRNTGVVEQMVEQFARADSLELAIPVEGTRKRVEKWKSGFYHVAHQAQVPIIMGFLDFANRVGGYGPQFMPSGDIDADMLLCQEFYEGMQGRNPQWNSPVRVRLPEEAAVESAVGDESSIG